VWTVVRNRQASKKSRCLRGVTLVELLIVIAIIGMLVQLMLPAVQSSREAARRTVCQNNLRQIMTAVRAHDSALSYLPTAGWGWAWMGDPDRGPGKTQPGSWAYQILPFMDYRDVHEIGRGATGDEKIAALTRLAATPAEIFYCPTRRPAVATPNVGPQVSDHVEDFEAGDLFWFNAKKADRLARTDYAANVGDRFVYWNTGPTPEQAEKGEGFFKFRDLDGKEPKLEELNGVVIQRQPILLSQIVDGTSNTYLVGEKNIPIEAYDAGWNANDDQSCRVYNRPRNPSRAGQPQRLADAEGRRGSAGRGVVAGRALMRCSIAAAADGEGVLCRLRHSNRRRQRKRDCTLSRRLSPRLQ
jgi:prepilin-type N-terminal cleavage/methylation domain-containing protein